MSRVVTPRDRPAFAYLTVHVGINDIIEGIFGLLVGLFLKRAIPISLPTLKVGCIKFLSAPFRLITHGTIVKANDDPLGDGITAQLVLPKMSGWAKDLESRGNWFQKHICTRAIYMSYPIASVATRVIDLVLGILLCYRDSTYLYQGLKFPLIIHDLAFGIFGFIHLSYINDGSNNGQQVESNNTQQVESNNTQQVEYNTDLLDNLFSQLANSKKPSDVLSKIIPQLLACFTASKPELVRPYLKYLDATIHISTFINLIDAELKKEAFEIPLTFITPVIEKIPNDLKLAIINKYGVKRIVGSYEDEQHGLFLEACKKGTSEQSLLEAIHDIEVQRNARPKPNNKKLDDDFYDEVLCHLMSDPVRFHANREGYLIIDRSTAELYEGKIVEDLHDLKIRIEDALLQG